MSLFLSFFSYIKGNYRDYGLKFLQLPFFLPEIYIVAEMPEIAEVTFSEIRKVTELQITQKIFYFYI